MDVVALALSFSMVSLFPLGAVQIHVELVQRLPVGITSRRRLVLGDGLAGLEVHREARRGEVD